MRGRVVECSFDKRLEIRDRITVAFWRDVARSCVVGRRMWIREPDLACVREQLARSPELILEFLDDDAVVDPLTFARGAGGVGLDGSAVATLVHVALARVTCFVVQRGARLEPARTRVVRGQLPA